MWPITSEKPGDVQGGLRFRGAAPEKTLALLMQWEEEGIRGGRVF